MSDYPKQAKLFKKWADAMLAGATVGKPNYSQTRTGSRTITTRPTRRRQRLKRWRKKRKKNAKEA